MRRALLHETDAVIAFYRKLMTDNASSPYHPDWRPDIYPTDKQIADYIAREELYVRDEPSDAGKDKYIAAFALSGEPVDGYDTVQWRVNASWEETAVVHLLCVACAYQHRGIGRQTVDALLSICRDMGKKAVRLDVMTKNLPAQKLYASAGFVTVGQYEITYEDTGTMYFYMYEYDLTAKGDGTDAISEAR